MSSKKTTSATTPLMEQYLSIKSQYKDMILLFRMGDFYETFYEDAKIISRTLGIALTKRAHGKSADVPLAGFPYHALDNYLPRLVAAGNRVAICEQVEDPRLTKTIVKREVVEIITPGTALSDKLLDQKINNYIVAIVLDHNRAGVSYADFSTGELYLCEVALEQLVNYVLEINPREVLLPRKLADQLQPSFDKRLSTVFTLVDDWIFSHTFAYETLTTHFRTPNLKGFGAEDFRQGICAAGAIMYYGRENFQSGLDHVQRLSVISADSVMILDNSTRRNLEITNPIAGQDREGTLLSVIDRTLTPMGGRMLRNMVTHPLTRLEQIQRRLDQVTILFHGKALREKIREYLESISDLERLLARVATGRATPRDLLSLKVALSFVDPIIATLAGDDHQPLDYYRDGMKAVGPLVQLLEEGLAENPPQQITEGGIMREGYDKDLDELRHISREGKSWIVQLQEDERTKTGIPTLKTGYNKVFGYYFEVTRAHASKVPDYFIRKQTLVNAERYITPELKEYEEKVLGAEERMASLEYELFQQIREKAAGWGQIIQENARLIAELDCMSGLARVAEENDYTAPELHDGDEIILEDARHPVVERLLPPDQPFIENNCLLDNKKTQIMVITGPNMSGKSTYLRQVGLIVLLAQIGSFVPAARARIGIVDRIFTRVGASDNLAFGESTFMVEMLEAANILNNATPRSLILLDEVGRGTSTFDGLSIAWAVTEYLHHNKNVAAKTLFATHYHELTELAMRYPRIENFRVAVREYEDHVVFLRKIEPGGMDNSYGIYVAQMAGLPPAVVERAREVLHNLEANDLKPGQRSRLGRQGGGRSIDKNQLNFFQEKKNSLVEAELRKVEINQITPLDALLKLRELKDLLSN